MVNLLWIYQSSKCFLKSIGQERGSSLLAVMAVLSLIAMSASGLSSMRAQQVRGGARLRAAEVRDLIAVEIRRAIVSRQTYLNSILAQQHGIETANTDLMTCFLKQTTPVCNKGVAYDVKLYSPNSWGPITGGGGSSTSVYPITGTTTSPAYYDESGLLCAASFPPATMADAEARCAFKVTTTFTVTLCDPGDTTTVCAQAYKAHTHFSLQQLPSYAARSLPVDSIEEDSRELKISSQLCYETGNLVPQTQDEQNQVITSLSCPPPPPPPSGGTGPSGGSGSSGTSGPTGGGGSGGSSATGGAGTLACAPGEIMWNDECRGVFF
jgi:uncharacterized membrane protein YgcG